MFNTPSAVSAASTAAWCARRCQPQRAEYAFYSRFQGCLEALEKRVIIVVRVGVGVHFG